MKRLLLLAAFGLTFAQAATAAPLRDYVHEINRVRAAHKLRPLRSAPNVRYAANAHGRAIARHGYFGHAMPTRHGAVPFGRWVKRYVPSRCIAGENLAWTTWNATAREVVAMWMRSPSHRENLLRRSYRHIGVAVTRGPDTFYQTLVLESC